MSPFKISPTPSGVPVIIKSPFSSVIILEIYSIISSIEKIKNFVFDSCFNLPFNFKENLRLFGFEISFFKITLDIGENVSKPFAMLQGKPFFLASV